MSKNKTTVIQILNPLPGGANYTNSRRALNFIRMGRAEQVGPYSIRFTHRLEVAMQIGAEHRLAARRLEFAKMEKQPWRRADDDLLVDGRLGRALPWNGCDTREKAFHLPFTAQAFPSARLRIPATALVTASAMRARWNPAPR